MSAVEVLDDGVSGRWLVTGACGQLGAHVMEQLAHTGAAVLGVGARPCPGAHGTVLPLDLRRGDDLDAVLRRYRPTHVVHLAAVSAPGQVALDPRRGWALNTVVARRLAAYARQEDAWMLYPSSDFIWEGTARRRYREQDAPVARSAYACTKLAGERAVLEENAGVVARFSLLQGDPLCPRQTTWTRVGAALRAGREVPVCADEYRTPLALTAAARVVVGLGQRRARGLLHVAGPEVLTPRDLVARVAEGIGVVPRLRVISRRDLPGGAERPANMAMSGALLAARWPELAPGPLRVRPAFGVVIPVYRGADVLHRSIGSLAEQEFPGDLHVALAVNDGEPRTLRAAQRLAPVLRAAGARCAVLLTPPGRVPAINAAEAVLPAGPRLYLDQDAVLSPGSLTGLARALAPGTGTHFAVPTVHIAHTDSVVSRAYYRTWRSLPYVRQSPATMGAYAVSALGRTRWPHFAPIRSDDKWVRWHFAPEERAVVTTASYEVIVPRGPRELVRARRRYQKGNDELTSLPMAHGDGEGRHRGVVGALLRRPASGAVFLGVHAAAVVLDRWSPR
ncbi:dTDP-4-dehydrorhamnose reductase [Actinokineospora baliensis]|uniref:sugar nucleotide-binding protein n=1 Tax=Actinokineospora baliensis TaxID=547056 RepID=UPI00195B95B1|nr:sugar nucleotide-binding protein [Actinokineospora baliensis]MBM7773365.1 dTDP-4-dehydrorhamnose reductase [Actinokineospora baliensis]